MAGHLSLGSLRVDLGRCHPSMWSRFSYEMTKLDGGQKMFRDLLLDNFVSWSVPGTCTHRDIATAIAQFSHKPIPIKHLPDNLHTHTSVRGITEFGFPGDCFDRIALNHEDMWWWISGDGLKMGILLPRALKLSPFEQLSGRLMCEALSNRGINGRIPVDLYRNIAVALDKAGFKPISSLRGLTRDKLGSWNKRHTKDPIHTFQQAISSRLVWLRVGLRKHLYRAAKKFKKAYPESSAL